MTESFLLSNMAPQVVVGFNRSIWKNLEDAIRGWVEQRGSLTIITGPVFAAIHETLSYKITGDNKVAVPTHFFKIVVDANSQVGIQALSFIIPNENLSWHSFDEFLTSFDDIEKLTGLDFLSALSSGIQASIESAVLLNIW